VTVSATVLEGDSPFVFLVSDTITAPAGAMAAAVWNKIVVIADQVTKNVRDVYPNAVSPALDVVCYCGDGTEHEYGTGPLCSKMADR
jgi:hypothetical protein